MNPEQAPNLDLSPVGALALLWPAVPDCLVSAAQKLSLEAAAARLAPIARVALELRLGEGQDEVDLHQYVSSSADDAAVLKRHLARNAVSPRGGDPAQRFLTAWANDAGGARADIEGFFLEWDGPGSSDERPPAIFLPVQDRYEREAPAVERRRTVALQLERLGLASGRVTELLCAIPADLSISYVGAMLGRGEAIRINLRGIRPEDLGDVLEELGWPGEIERARDRFARLVELTGQVAVALDFAPELRPTIGFETVLPDFPAREPRWHALLDQLCSDGLCTPEKRTALEALGARLYPETKMQQWPAPWIAATVAAPTSCVPWFERRLSHVKVTIAGTGEVAAKAYVSAQHHWYRDAASKPYRKDVAAGDAIADGADRAVKFLLAERQQDDFWRDFRLVNGSSDEWVTAFIGYALATGGVEVPDAVMAQTVAALFRRQRPDGGWGYNRISPADADSTTWALKFFEAVGCSSPETDRARAFLRSHLLPSGGIATYAPSTKVQFQGAGDAVDDAGWRSAHACVAANAASLMGEPLISYLSSSQAPDGAWTAYWWRDDSFATALAVDSVGTAKTTTETRRRAVDWARSRAASAKAAFDRAWLVRILAQGDAAAQDQARAMAAQLLAEQRPDGGWDASAEMLFPDPSERRRRPDAPIVLDEARLFTTASVLLALSAVRSVGDGL